MVENMEIVMGGHGYPNAGRIPYYGGLDDVVEGISSHLPQNYTVHVLAHSSGEDMVIHRPKENICVYGSPGIPFRAGEEYRPLYTPLGRHCDGFMSHALDSKLHALTKIVPGIIKDSEGRLVAHMHDYFSGPLGIELKKNNLPLIFHSHLSADREFMDPYYSSIRDTRLFYEKVSCDNADIVIAVSQDTKESLVKAYQLPPEKIRVIENAIDTERFRPQKEIERQKNEEYLAALGITESHRPYIYWKGRLVHEKGADKLIRAFEIFSPNHPEYSLIMTGFRGSGEYYSELLNIRGKLPEKIRDKIIILNQQVDVIPFDQNCEFAVYPSSYEAFGLMAVQSEACAKTVVAGNGGLKHNVKGGVTGIHIDPYRPQSIAEGMEVAHQNKKGWGSNAREFAVENYSLKNRISDYTKIYEEALERA